MKKILYVFRGPIQKRVLGQLDRKEPAPTEFLYGMNRIDQDEFEVNYVIASREERKMLFYPFQFVFAVIVKLGIPIELYPLFKKDIQKTDVIFCINDATSFGILFWKMLGKVDAEVFVLMHSLPERIKYFRRNILVRKFIEKLLSHATMIFTLSEYVQQDFIADFHLSQSRVKMFAFGVDAEFWGKSEGRRKDFILSIGNDGNRDYKALIEALLPHQHLVIITKRKIDTGNKNVTIFSDLTDEQVRDYYQKATCVVIPSRRIKNESAGLSTTLQAMACERPVVVSAAPPLQELFQDEVDCFFYTPEDSFHLREVLRKIEANPQLTQKVAKNGYEKVRSMYTIERMAQTITKTITETENS